MEPSKLLRLRVEFFPDVSNTRFGSYGEAAVVLLVHLIHIRQYLENISYRKGTPGLNHMQANLKKALEDIPTLTELAALALYTLCVSRPYMKLLEILARHPEHVLDPSTPPEDIFRTYNTSSTAP